VKLINLVLSACRVCDSYTEFSVRKRHAFRPTVLLRNLHNSVVWVKILYIIIVKSSAAGGFAPRPKAGLRLWTPLWGLPSLGPKNFASLKKMLATCHGYVLLCKTRREVYWVTSVAPMVPKR